MKLAASAFFFACCIAAAFPMACSDSESSTQPAPWSPGTGGSGPDGSAGAADSGPAGSSGSAPGGNAGQAGQASDASVDSGACDASDDGSSGCDANLPVPEAGNDAGFWNGTQYGGQCPPSPADGYHSPGQDCMFCHNGSIGPSMVFGGTIYGPDHVQGAAGVEIGVRAASGFFLGCSASNGNFWVWGTPDIDWANAEIRMRNPKGQAIMKSAGAAACNSCHAASPLVAP